MNVTKREAEMIERAFGRYRQQTMAGFELTFAQIQTLPVTKDCPECER